MAQDPIISVVISTYNSLEWLQKTLWSYEQQTFRLFEIVIADDGSTQDTATFIEEYNKENNRPVIHVWHEDNGFQKSTILNKALLACTTDYIVMSDGDCLAREDFYKFTMNVANQDIFFLVDITNCRWNFQSLLLERIY